MWDLPNKYIFVFKKIKQYLKNKYYYNIFNIDKYRQYSIYNVILY